MNKRELVLTSVIFVAFMASIFIFTDKQAFDCFQPTYNQASTCSITGSKCIKAIDKRGFTGILGTHTDEPHTSSVKCHMFGCSIESNTKPMALPGASQP